MPPRSSLEDKLTHLSILGRAPLTDEGRRELRAALAGSNNLLAARAAQVTGRSGEEEFIPALIDAFLHLLRQPAEADKNCRAKEAIIQALEELGCRSTDVYLQGITYVQMEPVYGGQTDTAVGIRCDCAHTLARLLDPEAHFALATLLADSEPSPRVAAVNALAYLGDEKAELLLRLKALIGDEEPGVLGRCFSALLAMDSERSLPFISAVLAGKDRDIAWQAALALGESCREDAFASLRARREAISDLEERRNLLLPIALNRSEPAFAYLLAVIRDDSRSNALKAIESMAFYHTDDKRRAAIKSAVLARRDPRVTAAFEREFKEEAG